MEKVEEGNHAVSTEPQTITVYGKPECVDTVRARGLLDSRGTGYLYINVEVDETQRDHAREVSGSTSLPVIVLPSGKVLVEPSDQELVTALED